MKQTIKLNKEQLVNNLYFIFEEYRKRGGVKFGNYIITDDRKLRAKIKDIIYNNKLITDDTICIHPKLSIKVWDEIVADHITIRKSTFTELCNDHQELKQLKETQEHKDEQIVELKNKVKAYQELISIIDKSLTSHCMPPLEIILEDYKIKVKRILDLDI